MLSIALSHFSRFPPEETFSQENKWHDLGTLAKFIEQEHKMEGVNLLRPESGECNEVRRNSFCYVGLAFLFWGGKDRSQTGPGTGLPTGKEYVQALTSSTCC